MVPPNSNHSVAAIDELLDQLAVFAQDAKIQTPPFLSRSVQVAEALLGLRWAAFVGAVGEANEKQAKVLFLAGSDVAAREFSGIESVYPRLKNADGRQAGWLDCFEQSTTLAAVEIVFAGRTWGWLIAAKEAKQHFKSVETEVLAGIAETVSEHLLTQLSAQHSQSIENQSRLDSFKLNAHRSLDLKQIAKLIVNDARWLCQVERVSLLTASRRGKFALAAVSSVATLDRKSDLKVALERMANLAVAANMPLASDRIAGLDNARDANSESLSVSVQAWQRKHGDGFLFGLPVLEHGHQTPIGFLVFEAEASIDRPKFARSLRQIEPHVSLAMSNARRVAAIPFRRSLQWIGARSRLSWLAKVAMACMLLVGMLLAFAVVEQPFAVRTHGELLPRIERQVCAQMDGNLATVHVEHGQSVRQGQVLATIENSDLEAELDDVGGEYAKTKQLLESKKILLGQYGHSGDQSLTGRLAAEIGDLNFQLELLDSRRKFLVEKQKKLNVIASQSGQIITWQTHSKLLGKPVRWGDELFRVADLNGPWDVVLRVPENRIGYILGALSSRDSQAANLSSGGSVENDESAVMSVQFFLQSDPATKYQAEIVEVCRSAEIDPDHGKLTVIRCTVPSDLMNRRHGATIVADVDCGQRPMWFVYFGEFYDGVRRRWVW